MQAEKAMPDFNNVIAARQGKFTAVGDYVGSRGKTRALVLADAQVPFAPRPTDTFIATYPKCGTTWMMQIVHQLRTGGSMQFPEIYAVVPFFDLAPSSGIDRDQPQVAEPRAFKTHLAWDLMPKGGRYIYVLRDPGDALVSYYHYVNGVFLEKDAISIDEFAREAFLAEAGPWGCYWDHVCSWWPQRERPNVLMLCFEDMKRDLAGTIVRVAGFLGLEADPTRLERVARQASFEFMKEHARQFVSGRAARDVQARYGLPSDELWVQIRSGRTGDSRNELSAETIRQFNAVWKREIEGPLGFAAYDDLRACLTSASRAGFNRAPEREVLRV